MTAEKSEGFGPFHAPTGDYRASLYKAAQVAGIENPKIVTVEMPAGSIAFHHQDMWHGSGKNTSTHLPRRALGVHLLNNDVKFKGNAAYIYGRYKRGNRKKPDEYFFPIVWTKSKGRSSHLEKYCSDVFK